MSAAGYGEGQPRLDDDRLPVMLVILDGLGDRPISDLGGLTPSEAAVTPVLDRLTQRGASGWHVPLGWGRAPSSELAHWAMFGYTGVPFPGRAVLEGIGAGVEVPTGIATTFAALRTSEEIDGRAWLTGRAGCEDHLDADALLGALGSRSVGVKRCSNSPAIRAGTSPTPTRSSRPSTHGCASKRPSPRRTRSPPR